MLRTSSILALCALPGCLLLEDACEIPDDGNLLGDGSFDALTCWYDSDEHDWTSMGLREDVESPQSGAPVFSAMSEGLGAESLVLKQGPWFSSLRTSSLGLEEGDHYTVTFWARADTPTSVTVAVRSPTVPWSESEVLVGTEWTLHPTFGTAGGGLADDAWIEFQLGADATEIFLDDIALVEDEGADG